MEGARRALAQRVLAALVGEPAVRSAILRGSLATGTANEFSDIDVAVDVSGADNGHFATRIPTLLGRHFPVLFSDWAPSLLPKKYVQTCFLNDAPIFWNVDIECVATPHVPSLTHVTVEPHDHLLKLWVLDAKYLLRGAAAAEPNIRRLAARVLPAADAATGDLRLLMRQVLDDLTRSASPARDSFLQRCREVQRRIEALSEDPAAMLQQPE
jgi:hypothetical protein